MSLNQTDIDWVVNQDGTKGFTWNPWTGCLHDCDGGPKSRGGAGWCYARRIAHSLRGKYGYPDDKPFAPTFHPNRLEDPLHRKKPSRIFAVDMGDPLGAWVPREWLDKTFDIMRQCPQHDFFLLTKNLARLRNVVFPDNCYAGFSLVTDAGEYTVDLGDVTAPIKFVSAEPLRSKPIKTTLFGVDWLIIGAETCPADETPTVVPGPKWGVALFNYAEGRGIPVWVKDNFPWPRDIPRPREMPTIKRPGTARLDRWLE